MYEEQREDRGNNLLGNVVIGAGLLGAGALAGNYARSVFKNRDRKAQAATSTDMPRSGQGGVQRMDLSALPDQTKAGVYQRAREKYPDPGVGKDVQYRNPGSGGTDLSMLITDPNTGEIYRRGGGQSVNQQQASTQGGINLAKQNLGGPYSKPTVQNGFLEAMRNSNTQLGEVTAADNLGEMNYVRNRIASQLEAAPQSVGPNIQMRDLPPASALGAQPTTKGINSEKAARIERNRQKDMLRINDYMSDVLESSISETEFLNEQIPSNILKLAERAGTGTASAQDVGLFRNWAQSQFKNDPTVLGEINETVAPFLGQQPVQKQQPVQAKPSGSSGPKSSLYSSEGPVDAADRRNIAASRANRPETLVQVREQARPFVRDAQNEAIQTANDQSDAKFFKNLQRNEDVDLTIVNEDILDKQKARAFDQLMSDAEGFLRDKQIASEIDLKFDYTSEEARQAADVGAALERIRNNPTRVAAERVIADLQAEGRAERDLARFQSEGLEGGELSGLKAEDNTRQRSEQQGSRSMTGEQLEEVLLGESKVIDSNMRGRALRGGSPAEESNYYRNEGDISYKDASDQWRDASTGTLTNTPYVASGPKTPEGAASIVASEAIRKKYQNQGPEPLKGPAADVARSMQVIRQGMEAEPREVRPSTQVPTIHKGGYADDVAVIAVPPETAFTGDAADAAGPVLFTGKNKRDSAVVGTSPPLTQGGISFVPEVAEYNERMAQNFLNRAIDKGLTEKANPTVEVYKTPRIIGPAEVAGPGSVPLSRTAAPSPEMGPDPSQRTGYARYTSTSKPVGTPSTGATTVGINYAELPQSDTSYFSSRDIGRTPYAGPVQTYAERLAQSTGGTATPMSMLPDRGDGRTTRSIQPPAYDPRYKTAGARVEKYPVPETPTRTVYRDPNTGATFVPVEEPKAFELRGPAPIAADAGPVRLSIPADPARQEVYKPASFEGSGQDVIYNRMYAPQVRAGKQAVVTYPHMRGQSLFPTGTLMNDPNTRGGPVKFEGRERREDEYVRPLSERLGRGDTMKRFPIIRRG